MSKRIAASLAVDVELASVIAAWDSLQRNIKDNVLALTCLRQSRSR
jgi:hypothetical protein